MTNRLCKLPVTAGELTAAEREWQERAAAPTLRDLRISAQATRLTATLADDLEQPSTAHASANEAPTERFFRARR